MKSFREFIFEATARRAPRNPGESLEDYVKRVKGIENHPDLSPDEATRKYGRTTNVSGQDIRGVRPPTGEPPRSNPLVRVPSNSSALSTNVRPPIQQIRTNMNVPGGRGIPGLKSGSVLSGIVASAKEKSSGSGWGRSLAKGTATALGTLAGGALGSAAGPVGTFAGGYAGGAAAEKAFDVAAGANAVQRKQMQVANRQRQAGGGLAGIGGQTTFSKGKGGTGFMTTGSGSQRKTVQLAKTSVVKDPKTGQLATGNLAFKGGKAVYKRAADPSSLAQTSSNPLERVGRSLFAGAYKQQDEKIRQQKLKQAAQSDIRRQQALGVKGSKNLVGPKIVGPKIVGPAKPAAKPA